MAPRRLARFAQLLRRTNPSASSRNRPRRRRLGWVEQLEPRILLNHSPTHLLDQHNHAHLSIFIDSVNQDIPGDIGTDSTGVIDFVHTHDGNGLLHTHPTAASGDPTDFQTLDDFFRVWRTNAGDAGNNPDATFNQNQVLDAVVDADHVIRFFVNGGENDDFENYVLKDGDQIRFGPGHSALVFRENDPSGTIAQEPRVTESVIVRGEQTGQSGLVDLPGEALEDELFSGEVRLRAVAEGNTQDLNRWVGRLQSKAHIHMLRAVSISANEMEIMLTVLEPLPLVRILSELGGVASVKSGDGKIEGSSKDEPRAFTVVLSG